MLNELSGLQSSDESIWHVNMSFEIETRCEESGELVHKTYTFSYAKEWDKWTFQEYHEERTPDTTRITDRNWTRSRHILWSDVSETPTIDVPPEVADALAKATGAESVTIQVPVGGINENEYETIKEATGRAD
jgi:hypothetical protein